MKIDNFTTARCSKCGWIRQFQPGVEHDAKDFICDCKEVKDEKEDNTEFVGLMTRARGLGLKFPHNISIERLRERVEEAINGNSDRTTQKN